MCCYTLNKDNVIRHAASNNARKKHDSSDNLSVLYNRPVEVLQHSIELQIISPGSSYLPNLMPVQVW